MCQSYKAGCAFEPHSTFNVYPIGRVDPCSIAFTPKPKFVPVEFPYNSNEQTKTIADNHETIFFYKPDSSCSIHNGEILESGCTDPLTNENKNLIQMDASYKISATSVEADGYSKTFCFKFEIKSTANNQIFTFTKEHLVTQLPLDCS